MNIVQINKFIEKIAGCTELVHSFYTDSVYECWNGSGDVDYGSFVFCIKKTRMRERTMVYDAIVYYGDRLLDDKSNRDAIWSDATNVIQSIIGAVNNVEGEISIGYPYEINLFEQKFADELAGAYANISIEVEGVGECADLLYGYENVGDNIKLESITKTFTVNGTYDIVTGDDYDAISDVKVIVDVTPIPKETFASIGYNEETAGVYLNTFEKNIDYAKKIQNEWDPNITSMSGMFKDNQDINFFPYVNTSKCNDFSNTFYNCTNLQAFPSIDMMRTGRDLGVVATPRMFYNCIKLNNLPIIRTAANDMSSMFNGCTSLTELNLEMNKGAQYAGYLCHKCTNLENVDIKSNTSYGRYYPSFENSFYECTSLKNVNFASDIKPSTLYYAFYKCTNLPDLPQINTSECTSFSHAFGYCDQFVDVDMGIYDVSKVTSYSAIFYACENLKYVRNLNTSNAKDVDEIFAYCYAMEHMPYIDIKNATSLGSIVRGIQNLKSMPKLNCDKIQSSSSPFGYSTMTSLTDIGGFENLKASITSYFIDRVPNVTVDSLMNVINNLYDWSQSPNSGKYTWDDGTTYNYGTTHKISIGSANLNKLTAEQIAIATAKGWTLT